MLKIIVTGSKGRMGQAVAAGLAQDPDLQLAALVDQGDNLGAFIQQGDVVIDFSSHSATKAITELCARNNKPVVIGTTGHANEERAAVTAFASVIPIVLSANFSTGVNALFWLTRKAAEILGSGYDLEVVEMHHRFKTDAPSGTARTLAEILAKARQQQLAQVVRHGRSGLVGERTTAEIGLHSLRGGDVVGDHTVIFAGLGERLELTHKASSRDTFARGALRAAKWVVSQKPGLYNMQDVLGLA